MANHGVFVSEAATTSFFLMVMNNPAFVVDLTN